MIIHMPSIVLVGYVTYNVLIPNKYLFKIEPTVFGSTCYVRDVRPSIIMLNPKASYCIFGLFFSSEGVSML